jgi:hypothetical protein
MEARSRGRDGCIEEKDIRKRSRFGHDMFNRHL